MKLLTGFYAKMMNKFAEMKDEEKGSQTLEWVGIAAVIIIVVGLVSTAFGDSDFGDNVVERFEQFLSRIGSGG